MVNARYKRVSGTHAGQTYVVIGPFSEIETPLRWVLHNEADAADRPVVAEDALNDAKQWAAVA